MGAENNRLLFLTLMVVAVVGVVRLFSTSPGYYFLTNFSADEEWIDISKKALARLQIPRDVVVNPTKPSGAIEIYIFDSLEIDNLPSTVNTGNCSYLGDGKSILCDIELVRSMLRHFDLDKRSVAEFDDDGVVISRNTVPETVEHLDRARLDLLTWILAHELGHLLQGHKGRFYFHHHGSQPVGDAQSFCHRMEFEADTYAIRLLPESEIEDFYFFNYDLLNRELSGLACPDIPKVAFCENVMAGTGLALTGDTIEDLLSGSHPKTIVRLIRLGEFAQSRQDFGILAFQIDDVVRYQLETVGKPSWRCR